MELIGIQLQPASSARTELTFRLSTPFPLGPEDDTTAHVSRGVAVATLSGDDEPEIIFTTDEPLAIIPPHLVQLRRESDFHKNYLPRLGVETFYAFDRTQPRQGDTFLIGFDENQNISGHIVRLSFECEAVQAVGVRREDPPLVWECSMGDGQWQEISPSDRRGEGDTTGGLNNPQGSIIFYLPLAFLFVGQFNISRRVIPLK